MEGKSEIRKQMLTELGNPESVSMNTLSVVLLGAGEARRKKIVSALAGTQAQVVSETDLPGRDALPALLEGGCDILIVDLQEEPERGLDLIEAACGLDGSITVMACARLTDAELLVRCMRAG